MMQKFIRSQQLKQVRFFSAGYNYSAPSNPKVFLQLSRDGQNVGKLTFELF